MEYYDYSQSIPVLNLCDYLSSNVWFIWHFSACLYGDGLPGYVPLNGAKVGVPITPPGLASVDPQVIEDGEMIETAASDLESEASLEEWEDENQDDGETASFVGRMSRAPTYIDVMLGRVTKYGGLVHPADIGLSIIPTGLQSPLNHTELKATNMTEKTRKIMCVGRNMTENETAIVRIVNNTELLSTLMLKNDSLQPNCAIVMFYAPWCMFSARTAPHFNALARAFPQIDVLAIDAIHFSKWVKSFILFIFLNELEPYCWRYIQGQCLFPDASPSVGNSSLV